MSKLPKVKYKAFLNSLQNLIGYKPTPTEISKIINVSQNALSNRISKDGYFSDEEQSKILDHYDFKSNEGITIKADYFPDVFGSCGSGAFVVSENKIQIQIAKELISLYSKSKKYSVINAIGDSMMPYICDKDKLIVEHCEPFEQIKDNKVYVFCYNNEIFVKRLVKNIDEIIVKSDNPDPIYRVRYIEKEDMNNIFLIGQIVGLMRNTR